MRTIRLEILRPGPSDGQLLSPLTPYLAICDDNPPETFTIPYDHRTVMGRLARLRYQDGRSANESDLREAAEIARRVLESIHGFRATLLNEARHADTIHVQLVLTAAELAIIPFEFAYAPLSLNGVAPISVNSNARIAITRETRHLRGAAPTRERASPRVLFVVASPDGRDVPERAHYLALRRALKHLLPAEANEQEEKNAITWLRSASIDAIRRACAEKHFSHVHILAHGHRFSPEEERYGLRLHSNRVAGGESVDGNRLALALQSFEGRRDGTPLGPSVVTLAVCDSGNVGSVLYGDASLAHRLHEQDVPVVVASQFPMTFLGSAVFVEEFYSSLFQGDDPRKAVWRVRDALFSRSADTHDWASVVTYATLPRNLERRTRENRAWYRKVALDVRMSRVEALGEELPGGLSRTIELTDPALAEVEAELNRIRQEVVGLPSGSAEHMSLLSALGNAYKRLSIVCRPFDGKLNAVSGRDEEARIKRANALLTESCRAYNRLFELRPDVFWIAAQKAVADALVRAKNLPIPTPKTDTIRRFARLRCRAFLRQNLSREDRVDTLAQLVELALIGVVEAKPLTLSNQTKRLQQAQSAYLAAVDSWIEHERAESLLRLVLEARQFARFGFWWPEELRELVGSVPGDESSSDSKTTALLPALAKRGVRVTQYWSLMKNN